MCLYNDFIDGSPTEAISGAKYWSIVWYEAKGCHNMPIRIESFDNFKLHFTDLLPCNEFYIWVSFLFRQINHTRNIMREQMENEQVGNMNANLPQI